MGAASWARCVGRRSPGLLLSDLQRQARSLLARVKRYATQLLRCLGLLLLWHLDPLSALLHQAGVFCLSCRALLHDWSAKLQQRTTAMCGSGCSSAIARARVCAAAGRRFWLEPEDGPPGDAPEQRVPGHHDAHGAGDHAGRARVKGGRRVWWVSARAAAAGCGAGCCGGSCPLLRMCLCKGGAKLHKVEGVAKMYTMHAEVDGQCSLVCKRGRRTAASDLAP